MRPSARFLLLRLSTASLLFGLLGCTGEGTTAGSTTASTTTSGTGGGGAGGGGGGPPVDYPPCQDNQAIFTGDLDGQPFDKTIPTTGESLDQGNVPPYVTVYLPDAGKLHLIWMGLAEPEKPKPTTGYLILPGEMVQREVLVGSSVIIEGDHRVKVDLLMTQGHLIGCLRPL